MKIIALADNKSIDNRLAAIHGLSIYIETNNHKLLFDLGPDDTFISNAGALGIDLAEIDMVIISHGHYDHGGALARFFAMNDKAKIYIRRQAFEPHYQKVAFIKTFNGLNPDFADNEQIIFTDDTLRIDDEIFIFSDVDGPSDTKSSRDLLTLRDGKYVQDDFTHEQSLIITSEGQAVLLTGCSHRGIDNILKAAERHQPGITYVLGGFHLYNSTTKTSEQSETIARLATGLMTQEAVFYTCHCTGKKALRIMYSIMGEKLQYMSAGTIIEIPGP